MILDALNDLFENDQLLDKLEIYTNFYLKKCQKIHLENNQVYRLKNEDHLIYPFLKDTTACISPTLWKNLSENKVFKGENIKLR